MMGVRRFYPRETRYCRATASRHLTLLTDAGLLTATRKKGWTFYRRDAKGIQRFVKQLETEL